MCREMVVNGITPGFMGYCSVPRLGLLFPRPAQVSRFKMSSEIRRNYRSASFIIRLRIDAVYRRTTRSTATSEAPNKQRDLESRKENMHKMVKKNDDHVLVLPVGQE